MKKSFVAILIGMALVFVAILMISAPMREITDYHEENGKRTTATVKTTRKLDKIIRNKKGTFENTYYHLEVEFKNKKSNNDQRVWIKDFIQESEFNSIETEQKIEISQISKRPDKSYPKYLLTSTIDSSTMTKFLIAMKGDLSKHIFGLILLIAGGMTTLVAIGFLIFMKKTPSVS